MPTRFRPTAAQKRAIVAAIIRFEDEHRDELEALAQSMKRFETAFDEGGGLATEAGRAWLNHILRFVMGTPDVYEQPAEPRRGPYPDRLSTRGGEWQKVPGLPITVYELVEPAKRPG